MALPPDGPHRRGKICKKKKNIFQISSSAVLHIREQKYKHVDDIHKALYKIVKSMTLLVRGSDPRVGLI